LVDLTRDSEEDVPPNPPGNSSSLPLGHERRDNNNGSAHASGGYDPSNKENQLDDCVRALYCADGDQDMRVTVCVLAFGSEPSALQAYFRLRESAVKVVTTSKTRQ
jgi:hypothetical protein